MASLENRTGYWNIIFRFGGHRFVRSLRTQDEGQAEILRARLEDNIRLVAAGRLEIPEGADLPTFLLSDGKLNQRPVATPSLTLGRLFDLFFESVPERSLEASTLYTMKVHRRHIERILGKRFRVQTLRTSDLQRYVNARAMEGVTRTTINKELVTFSTVWAAGRHYHGFGEFPRKGLRLPKATEPSVFQTMDEIKRQLKNGGDDQLWEALYLTMDEIAELLRHVKRAAAHPFIYPMFCFAAYTGARRAEIVRSRLGDIDFEARMVTLRERKRKRAELSTRRVPLSPPLARALRAWTKQHPGGAYTFCHAAGPVPRSKTRRPEPTPLTRDEAHHHFRFTLRDSKWSVVRGWHTLRHSFISNCASKGIDQRMIDEWVGHSTEAMRRRYRHLLPSSQQQALKALFR